MIVWINGAFGAGKTHTAHELQRRLPGSHVADPELLGFALRKTLPASDGDFQDLPLWRILVRDSLIEGSRRTTGLVFVPMTLVRNDYFEEIVGGLRSAGVDVRHYALLTSRAELKRRLKLRSGYVLGRILGRDETWGLQQLDRCLAALTRDEFGVHVDNTSRSLDEVVEWIAADLGVTLQRPRLSPLRHQTRRIAVAAGHIRL